jgi:hypothetical protein
MGGWPGHVEEFTEEAEEEHPASCQQIKSLSPPLVQNVSLVTPMVDCCAMLG